jgi:hypothetical protein
MCSEFIHRLQAQQRILVAGLAALVLAASATAGAADRIVHQDNPGGHKLSMKCDVLAGELACSKALPPPIL